MALDPLTRQGVITGTEGFGDFIEEESLKPYIPQATKDIHKFDPLYGAGIYTPEKEAEIKKTYAIKLRDEDESKKAIARSKALREKFKGNSLSTHVEDTKKYLKDASWVDILLNGLEWVGDSGGIDNFARLAATGFEKGWDKINWSDALRGVNPFVPATDTKRLQDRYLKKGERPISTAEGIARDVVTSPSLLMGAPLKLVSKTARGLRSLLPQESVKKAIKSKTFDKKEFEEMAKSASEKFGKTEAKLKDVKGFTIPKIKTAGGSEEIWRNALLKDIRKDFTAKNRGGLQTLAKFANAPKFLLDKKIQTNQFADSIIDTAKAGDSNPMALYALGGEYVKKTGELPAPKQMEQLLKESYNLIDKNIAKSFQYDPSTNSEKIRSYIDDLPASSKGTEDLLKADEISHLIKDLDSESGKLRASQEAFVKAGNESDALKLQESDLLKNIEEKKGFIKSGRENLTKERKELEEAVSREKDTAERAFGKNYKIAQKHRDEKITRLEREISEDTQVLKNKKKEGDLTERETNLLKRYEDGVTPKDHQLKYLKTGEAAQGRAVSDLEEGLSPEVKKLIDIEKGLTPKQKKLASIGPASRKKIKGDIKKIRAYAAKIPSIRARIKANESLLRSSGSEFKSLEMSVPAEKARIFDESIKYSEDLAHRGPEVRAIKNMIQDSSVTDKDKIKTLEDFFGNVKKTNKEPLEEALKAQGKSQYYKDRLSDYALKIEEADPNDLETYKDVAVDIKKLVSKAKNDLFKATKKGSSADQTQEQVSFLKSLRGTLADLHKVLALRSGRINPEVSGKLYSELTDTLDAVEAAAKSGNNSSAKQALSRLAAFFATGSPYFVAVGLVDTAAGVSLPNVQRLGLGILQTGSRGSQGFREKKGKENFSPLLPKGKNSKSQKLYKSPAVQPNLLKKGKAKERFYFPDN